MKSHLTCCFSGCNFLFQSAIKVYVIFVLALSALSLTGCGSEEEELLPDNLSLSSYISQLNLPVQRDSLIACAASGQFGILQDDMEQPVSILYLPLENIRDLRYFEATSLPDDFEDFSAYRGMPLTNSPLLDGVLRKLNRPATSQEAAGFVTFIRNNKLFISNRIHIKDSFQPTVFLNNEITINQNVSLMPEFSWQDLSGEMDAIYFHVMSDENDVQISGTYTFETNFQFYNLDNVVLNITDPTSNPMLINNRDYILSIMAVSIDNWVNFLATREFSAE